MLTTTLKLWSISGQISSVSIPTRPDVAFESWVIAKYGVKKPEVNCLKQANKKSRKLKKSMLIGHPKHWWHKQGRKQFLYRCNTCKLELWIITKRTQLHITRKLKCCSPGMIVLKKIVTKDLQLRVDIARLFSSWKKLKKYWCLG